MSEPERLLELGRFLKDRRARVSPVDAGLPPGARRRVRGLRREEVASLAGIGLSWYTALENGDAKGVSEATLLSVARALRLSESERDYVLDLINRSEIAEPSGVPDRLVVATVKAILFPAYVITATWDVLDCNEAFRRVWAVEERELPFNAIERLFLDPAARKLHGENFAANFTPVIAMLRSAHGRRPYWNALQRLRDRLIADDAIRAIWDGYEISSPLLSNRCVLDTPLGIFRYETLTLPISGTSQAIVVQVPDASSAARLATP
jgi:transcriptional regulator with XRE-family HTH domain